MKMESISVIFAIGALAAWGGVVVGVVADGRPIANSGKIAMISGAIVLVVWMLVGLSRITFARDLDGRYAQSTLKPWFDQLKSGKGLCCSDADGTALTDTDWESKGGHYR